MKKYFILWLLILFADENYIFGQTDNLRDSAIMSVLQGRTGPDISVVFPLANDIVLKNNQYPIVYPLLIINDCLLIKDEKILNCFRNHFDRKKIKKIKHITKEQAKKRGIPNVPKDGVLFVTTKRNYYFNFSCE